MENLGEDNILEKLSEITNVSLVDEYGNYKDLSVLFEEFSKWLYDEASDNMNSEVMPMTTPTEYTFPDK